jgi:P-type Ca2+ transporter type 2C
VASSDIGEEKTEMRDLLKQDPAEQVADNPFAFVPKQMAKLHDPKDLNVLRQMGGLDGVVIGLRTNVATGLSPDEDILERRVTLQDVWNELDARQRAQTRDSLDSYKSDQNGHDQPQVEENEEAPPDPGVKRSDTSISRLASKKTTLSSLRSPTIPKGFSDRKRVFGENRIPVRKPKSIFQLMWMALHDKILVLFLNIFPSDFVRFYLASQLLFRLHWVSIKVSGQEPQIKSTGLKVLPY